MHILTDLLFLHPLRKMYKHKCLYIIVLIYSNVVVAYLKCAITPTYNLINDVNSISSH